MSWCKTAWRTLLSEFAAVNELFYLGRSTSRRESFTCTSCLSHVQPWFSSEYETEDSVKWSSNYLAHDPRVHFLCHFRWENIVTSTSVDANHHLMQRTFSLTSLPMANMITYIITPSFHRLWELRGMFEDVRGCYQSLWCIHWRTSFGAHRRSANFKWCGSFVRGIASSNLIVDWRADFVSMDLTLLLRSLGMLSNVGKPMRCPVGIHGSPCRQDRNSRLFDNGAAR